MANENIKIKAILDTTTVDGSLTELKQKFTQLEDVLGSNMLSAEETQKVLIRMGQIKSSVTDFEGQINQLSSTNAFGDLVQVTTPLVGVLTAAGSATQLLGVENEELNSIIQQTTSLTVGLSAIREVADSKAIASIIKHRSAQVSALIVSKLTFDLTKKQAVANTAEATSKGIAGVATKLATRAQIAWNAAIIANPIGLLIAGVVALAVGVYALSKAFEDDTEEVDENTRALDGNLIANDDLRKSYNETVIELRKLDLEYQNITGSMSDYEYELSLINLETEKQLLLAKQQRDESLAEITVDMTTFWSKLRVNFLKYWGGVNEELAESIVSNEEETSEARQDIEEFYTKEIIRLNKQRNNQILKQEKKTNEEVLKGNENIIKQTLQSIDKVTDAYKSQANSIRSNLSKIGGNLDTFDEKLKKLNVDILPDNLSKDMYLVTQEMNNLADGYAKLLTDSKELNRINKEKYELNEETISSYDQLTGILKEEYDALSENLKIKEKLLQITIDSGGDAEKAQKDFETSSNYQLTLLAEITEKEIEISKIKKDQLDLKPLIEQTDAKIKLYEDEENVKKFITEKTQQEINKVLQKYRDIDNKKALEDAIKTQESIEKTKSDILELYSLQRQNQIVKNDKDIAKAQTQTEIDSIKQRELVKLNLQKKALEDWYKFKIDAAMKNGELNEAAILREQLKGELTSLEDDFTTTWNNIQNNLLSGLADIGGILSDALGELFSRNITQKFDDLNHRLTEETTDAKESLDNLRNADLISEEDYNQSMENIDKEAAEKSLKIRQDQAKAEKRMAIFSIAISTAMGIAKSWGELGPFGAPVAALIAFEGALQTALVASQPLPQYETGGMIDGLPHSQGGTTINAEKGEFVVNKDVVSQPGMASLLTSINNSNKGGYDNSFISEMKEMVMSITSIPVVNVESNSTSVQRKVSNIETRSKF